jgi:hypothetical protein
MKKTERKKDSKFLQNLLWTISLRERLGKNKLRRKETRMNEEARMKSGRRVEWQR